MMVPPSASWEDRRMPSRNITGPGDLGNRAEDSVFFFKMTSEVQEGDLASFDATPTIAVYQDDNITQLVTDGITLVEDFDGVSGLHSVKVDTSVHADYAIGVEFQIIVTGTIEATVVVRQVAQFSIEDRFMRGTDAASTLSAADVNAQVVDVIDTDTSGEPGQLTPPLTASLRTKVDHLYKNYRNRKTQTATQWSLYNDDAVTIGQKSTVSDNGTTADKTELISGL